jgi:Chloroplast import apparatus Tic20-like
MSWKGSVTAADRFFGSVAYLLPIIEVFSFGTFIFQQLPVLELLYVPLMPLMLIYGAINGVSIGEFGIGSFIFFLALYWGVVINLRIARFIRFNTLQAILIGIIISLCSLTLRVLLPLISGGSMGSATEQVLYNIVFLATNAACCYGIVMSLLGKYTEIPKISETAQLHIDRY